MRIRLAAVLGALLCATLGAAPAEAQGNTNVGELGIVFWSVDPDLVISTNALSSATGGATNDVDFVQTFGLDRKSFPDIRFTVGRSHKFRFSYVPVRYDAEATVPVTFRFNNQVFTAGIPASTDIKWDIWRFGYQWDFVSREEGYFGVVGELKYNKLDASVNSPVLTSTAATEQNAPVPTIGVAGRGYVHPMVSISGEFTGLKIDRSDFEAKFTDFDINAAVTFGRYIGIQGGYRAVTVEYFIDEDSGDLQLRGPYVGAVVKF